MFGAAEIHGRPPSGYRLPPDTSVGRVVLRVRSLDRSLEFYEQRLGFAVLERSSDAAVVGAGAKPLIELRAGASHPRSQRRLGLYHFAILLPDRVALGACLRELLNSGMHPGAADHLVSEALYIQDPDGLGIEIYRDRPREEWRIVGEQLAMASDPLDFVGLVEAAAGREWTGMPAGTSMGHIHLHVGDLDSARGFYHDGLGLDLTVWSYPGALFLSAGGYHHHLGVNTWLGPAAETAPEHEAQLLWWHLVLPSAADRSEATNSLTQHGLAISGDDAGTQPIADPWGTKLRLTTAA